MVPALYKCGEQKATMGCTPSGQEHESETSMGTKAPEQDHHCLIVQLNILLLGLNPQHLLYCSKVAARKLFSVFKEHFKTVQIKLLYDCYSSSLVINVV